MGEGRKGVACESRARVHAHVPRGHRQVLVTRAYLLQGGRAYCVHLDDRSTLQRGRVMVVRIDWLEDLIAVVFEQIAPRNGLAR